MFKATPFLTIANILTLFRIVVTPFLMYAVYSGNYYNAFILMIMGGLSDLFDGVAARYFQDASDLGELFIWSLHSTCCNTISIVFNSNMVCDAGSSSGLMSALGWFFYFEKWISCFFGP